MSTPAAPEATRRHAPLVSYITNTVVINITANVSLALGAAPAMVDIMGGAGPFARAASTLLINLGTPQPGQWDAAREAVVAAADVDTPWAPDPVVTDTLTHRTVLAREFLGRGPNVVRGSASEILVPIGDGSGGWGAETTNDAAAALDPACDLARSHGYVVAVSGPVDLVTDSEGVIHAQGGSALLTRVTGGGCVLDAVVATSLRAGQKEGLNDVSAVVATHAVHNVAVERAEARSTGPGSFPSAFLDALCILGMQDLRNVSVSAANAVTAVGGGPA